jgi:hypothetical protein
MGFAPMGLLLQAFGALPTNLAPHSFPLWALPSPQRNFHPCLLLKAWPLRTAHLLALPPIKASSLSHALPPGIYPSSFPSMLNSHSFISQNYSSPGFAPLRLPLLCPSAGGGGVQKLWLFLSELGHLWIVTMNMLPPGQPLRGLASHKASTT